MTYDEVLSDRIKNVFNEKRVSFNDRKIIGSLFFIVDDIMCCEININKKQVIAY
jgi:hypothetical protein